MQVKALCDFIVKREAVRLAKEAGLAPPWTKDSILATYRFCNVHREHDKVTRWISDNWRTPHKTDEDLWFAMIFARLFNLPSTLEAVGYGNVVLWNPTNVMRILKNKREDGPIFNGAYIVSTNGVAMDKVDYLINRVLRPLWAERRQLRPANGMTLEEFHKKLIKYDGLGSFIAAQVVADMKYVAPLKFAEDWNTFAAPGPGSRRGLNRVCNKPVDAPWPGKSWSLALAQLHDAVLARLHFTLHAQDLQNCLCELDKYERVRLGEGTPKQLYRYPDV